MMDAAYPVGFIDQWHSAVLLVQADDDRVVPLQQAVELIEGLRSHNIDHDVIIPNEVHDRHVTHRGCCCSMLRMCASIGISTSGACPLRKLSPKASSRRIRRIVRRRYDNRDNNEVVEFLVPQQNIRSTCDIRVPHAIQIEGTGGLRIEWPSKEVQRE
jgi:hypothetical protein